MKSFFTYCILLISLECISQCVPDSTYGDSLSGIYPTTGFPSGVIDEQYYQTLNIHIPSTLIESTHGDSSQLLVDTLGQTIYIGNFIVDSMILVEIQDMPPGITLECNNIGCVFSGGEIGCANLIGNPTNTGTYNIKPQYNIYFSGVIIINAGGVPLTIPVQMDYFSYFGEYISVDNYSIEILEPTSIYENIRENPYDIISVKNKILIQPKYAEKDLKITIHDYSGKSIYSEKIRTFDETPLLIENNFISGIYIIIIEGESSRYIKKIYIQ